MDGLQITGVADPEHGFISSKETFKVVKTSPDSTEKLFTTVGEGEAKRVTGLGSGDLVFIHGEQSALIDSTKVKLKDAAGNTVTLKDGVHTVVTDINLPDNASWAKIDDKSTIDSLKEDGKLANVTVKKLFKKSGASGSPLELSSQTSESKSEITKLMQADAQAERDSLRLHTMMEGNQFLDGKKDALANSFGQLMGITSGDGKLEVAAKVAKTPAAGDKAKEFTKSASHGGINAKYLEDVTGWEKIADDAAVESKPNEISEIIPKLFTPTASIINTYDGDSLAKMVKRDKGGIVESEEKYTSNGKTKQSIKRREDGSYDVKGYTSDGKLEKQQIAADGEGKIVTKQWKIEKGVAGKNEKVNAIESSRKGAQVGTGANKFENDVPAGKSKIEIKNHGSSANSGDEMVVLTGQKFKGAGAAISSSTFSALDGEYRDAGVVKETIGTSEYYRRLAYDEKHDCLQMTRALTSKDDALTAAFEYQLLEARKTLTSDISADQHNWRVIGPGGGDASALLNKNITAAPGAVFKEYASGAAATEKVDIAAIKAGFGDHLPAEYIPTNSIPAVADVGDTKSGRAIATYIWNSIHSDVASAALFGGFAKRV